jgi:hypothetical protein
MSATYQQEDASQGVNLTGEEKRGGGFDLSMPSDVGCGSVLRLW